MKFCKKYKIKFICRVFVALLVMLVFYSENSVAQRAIFPSLGESRSGTSGFQFLKINGDARSAAMGSSNAAATTDGASVFINPALAVQAQNSQVYLGHTAYFVDVSMNYVSYVHRVKSISLAGSLIYLNSGEMNETTEFDPLGTNRTFRTVHMAAGLTFSQKLTELFSYGITAKYLEEKFVEVDSRSVVFDMGFFYKVGDTGLKFAVGLNNYGLDSTPEGELTRTGVDGEIVEDSFEDSSAPSVFNIGAAYERSLSDDLNLLVTGQLTNPSDNAERYSIGAELEFLTRLYLRTGYKFGVEEAILPNAGVGFLFPLKEKKIGVDYGFSTRERLGSIHRIAVKFYL